MTSSEEIPNSPAMSCTRSLLNHPSSESSATLAITSSRIPRASCGSTTPTAAVCSRPTAAPNSAAVGPSTNITCRARSSGTTFSRLFTDASGAMTASTRFPFLAAVRTCSTPTTTLRARTPRPMSRNRRSATRGSSVIAISVRRSTPIRQPRTSGRRLLLHRRCLRSSTHR